VNTRVLSAIKAVVSRKAEMGIMPAAGLLHSTKASSCQTERQQSLSPQWLLELMVGLAEDAEGIDLITRQASVIGQGAKRPRAHLAFPHQHMACVQVLVHHFDHAEESECHLKLHMFACPCVSAPGHI